MEFGQLVVWLDHAEAHIIHFNREDADAQSIKAPSHHKSRIAMKGDLRAHAHYLDDIADALIDAGKILIVGPGLEKLVLVKHLMRRYRDIAEKVVGVETVDHPSDKQLLAYARKYFVRADQLL
jgi:stalled ribosome rescue protein Dom34